MLKFAERYVQGNEGVFANADTAYVLAYSVIMLNTDQHNPQVKNPMTYAEFMKNNRGINDGGNLPEEFMTLVFDEIKHNEIVMKDEDSGEENLELNAKQRRENAIAQAEDVAKRTEALYRNTLKHKQADVYHEAKHAGHAKSLFEIAWAPALSTLSSLLKEQEDLDIVGGCLLGFKHAVRISGLFDLSTQRNVFVSTLAKYTLLNFADEMRPKHIEAIKTLLDLAVSDGNHLKDSWRDVLRCVSQLERFQVISTHSLRYDQDVIERASGQDIAIAVDKIWTHSAHLTGAAIVDFVTNLTTTSVEEIESSEPRMYSLSKTVEITSYNMNRIRLEWSNIWIVLGEHFNKVQRFSD